MTEGVEVEGGWLPIETAPKDGTLVLLAPQGLTAWWECGDENWQVMHIHLNEDSTVADDWSGNPKRWYCLQASAWGEEPTHWQPLPAPPSVIRGTE